MTTIKTRKTTRNLVLAAAALLTLGTAALTTSTDASAFGGGFHGGYGGHGFHGGFGNYGHYGHGWNRWNNWSRWSYRYRPFHWYRYSYRWPQQYYSYQPAPSYVPTYVSPAPVMQIAEPPAPPSCGCQQPEMPMQPGPGPQR
jgi:hypothetical protein